MDKFNDHVLDQLAEEPVDASTETRKEYVRRFLNYVPCAKKSEVVDFLETFCDVSRGRLRAFVNRHFGDAFDLEKECPSCGKKAFSNEEGREMFGYRKMNGKFYWQSNCRDCR